MQVAADPVALLLDKAWYRFTYPDVAASGIEPLDHWLAFGCNEKRQPNFYFEPLWYLQQNPDVVGSGLDPLLHYALFGEAEGRKPSFFSIQPGTDEFLPFHTKNQRLHIF